MSFMTVTNHAELYIISGFSYNSENQLLRNKSILFVTKGLMFSTNVLMFQNIRLLVGKKRETDKKRRFSVHANSRFVWTKNIGLYRVTNK